VRTVNVFFCIVYRWCKKDEDTAKALLSPGVNHWLIHSMPFYKGLFCWFGGILYMLSFSRSLVLAIIGLLFVIYNFL
jgi:hypothetical protein